MSKDEIGKAAQTLDDLYKKSISRKIKKPPKSIRTWLDGIIDESDTRRAVLAVLITLILKKIISPEQDIRNHQAGMDGGFSGRGLDARVVTPFLKEKDFPYMRGGSGWLTRSLEQNKPYDENYPGQIKPASLKEAFLNVIKEIQQNNGDAYCALMYILSELSKKRDKRTGILLERPTNLYIHQIIERLQKHFASNDKGVARLPVLAVYAVYIQLIKEIKKYEGCELEALQPHTSADEKTGLLGDVQISANNRPIEAVEIKHNIKLTPEIVNDCYTKIKKTPIKTYYLLSTNDEMHNWQEISSIVLEIREGHGCQMIVNGLVQTLKYYLRLLKDTSAFIDSYVTLVENDQDVPYSLKIKWNI